MQCSYQTNAFLELDSQNVVEAVKVVTRVWKCNGGWHFFPSKVAFLNSLWTKLAQIWYTFNQAFNWT